MYIFCVICDNKYRRYINTTICTDMKAGTKTERSWKQNDRENRILSATFGLTSRSARHLRSRCKRRRTVKSFEAHFLQRKYRYGERGDLTSAEVDDTRRRVWRICDLIRRPISSRSYVHIYICIRTLIIFFRVALFISRFSEWKFRPSITVRCDPHGIHRKCISQHAEVNYG